MSGTRCVYEGWRADGGRGVVKADAADLNPCLWFCAHSPDGFGWGYSGSGPAQLALALLMHYFRRVEGVGKRCAVALVQDDYQHFKRVVIAGLPDSWQMDSRAIDDFLQARKRIKAGGVVDWNLWRASAYERGVLLAVSGTPVIRSTI